MNTLPPFSRPYIFFSVLLHIALLLFCYLLSSITFRKSLVVLGAYSRVPTIAYFQNKKTGAMASYGVHEERAKKGVKNSRARTPVIEKVKKNKKNMPAFATLSSAKKNKKSEKISKAKKNLTASKEKKELPKEMPLIKKEEPPQPPLKEMEQPTLDEGNEVLSLSVGNENEMIGSLNCYQNALQGMVDSAWSAPLGVAKGTECVATVIFDQSGGVKDFTIDHYSAVWIFNSSVMQALRSLEKKPLLAHKSFTITFRQ